MMKSLLKILLLILLPVLVRAQDKQQYPESLRTALQNAANDTIRMEINRKLGFYFQDGASDIGLAYHQSQLDLAKKLNLKLWEADAYEQIGYCYLWLDNLPASYESYINGLKIAEDPASAENGWGYFNFSYSNSPEEARQSIIGMIHYEMSNLYSRSRLFKEEKHHLFEALSIGEKLQNMKILSLSTRNIGTFYLENNKPDSAFQYFQKSLFYYKNSPYQVALGTSFQTIGFYYLHEQSYDSAKLYFQKAIDQAGKGNSQQIKMIGNSNLNLAYIYKSTNQLDSAMLYSLKGIKTAESINNSFGIAGGYDLLASIYKLQDKNSLAYEYLKKGKILGDSLNDAYINRLLQFQNIGFDQKIRLQELEKENQRVKSRNTMFALLTWLGIFLVFALILFRNNRQKQKANTVLETALSNLKNTQSQLIQSEKMASLGELTAGIAHEIQNPLNFVNNFSEVSSELVDEMNEELDKGNTEDAKEIAADLKQNLEKISHHGKRADAIVKGMLQHSRSSSSQKELTDINALADEYLRLAYHGLRAKDKNFNAKMETNLDPALFKIELVPQEIGRVLLNLFNNAFYAVSEKQQQNIPGYEPTVTVSTKKMDEGVQISVKDNGNGIPKHIKEKIFQPFFTTKPTGQGTGLGLSLSYDIVKAHGGELKVETEINKGTQMKIILPLKN